MSDRLAEIKAKHPDLIRANPVYQSEMGWLVAEVEKLRAEVKLLEAKLDEWSKGPLR